MIAACSNLVVSVYEWIYHKDKMFFESGMNTCPEKICNHPNLVINHSVARNFAAAVMNTVRIVADDQENTVVVASVVKTDTMMMPSVKENIETVACIVKDDVTIVANVKDNIRVTANVVHVKCADSVVVCGEMNLQKRFENELARLETDFFGTPRAKEMKTDARLAALEDSLCLCGKGHDMQERILDIKKSVQKLSIWLDTQDDAGKTNL
jgi:hypothetical protein